MVGGMHIVDAPRTPITRRGLISANTSLPAHPREAARRAAATTDAPEKLKQRITGSLFSSDFIHTDTFGARGGLRRRSRRHSRRPTRKTPCAQAFLNARHKRLCRRAHVKSVISSTSSLPSLRSSLRGPPPSISIPPAARGALALQSNPSQTHQNFSAYLTLLRGVSTMPAPDAMAAAAHARAAARRYASADPFQCIHRAALRQKRRRRRRGERQEGKGDRSKE